MSARHALIVGVSGVAAATACALALGGHITHLTLLYRSRLEEAQALQSALLAPPHSLAAVLLLQADVRSDAEVRQAFAASLAAHGPAHYVVNCAGATRKVELSDLEGATDDLWHSLYDTNVVGAFHVTRAAAAPGAVPRGGAIVNISSVAGRLAQGSSLPYACSKAALDCLTAAMARTLGPQGVRVLGVAPGFIAGEWLESLLGEGFEAARSAYAAALPLRSVCTPEDVASVVVALLTSAALMTGQTVVVDGGMCVAGFAATL
jgi:NAD(P)-dependent dehydrogenase (short-subunit alcohol dehydrogenase family)